ncbi:ATP-binding protein [Glaciihabitans arcticus]|uniref:histidine kinase n=1 Tax=Glaciihabitans arcticus TaxID=2668039 RepID=A0A4Q9GUR1_9MICO|nr:histidine kinase [Glaciihabitans arcticus]TBN56927.1 ATP-binding protein [Glaciihabitans arcticus]
MITWINDNPMVVMISLAVLAGVFLVLALVLLVSWLLARRGRRNERFDRVGAERDRIDLELALAEQTGRLRIIRELHEVAVHDLAVIINQADGAQYAAAEDPSAAVRAASVISEAAKHTLADLRRVMTVVSDGESAPDALPDIPSRAELFGLMRESGLGVEFTETGTPFELRPGAELAIYRILQESLRNALEHGGKGTQATVGYTWTDVGFQIRVDDDGARNALRQAGQDPNLVARGSAYDLDADLSALTTVASGATMTEMRERTELFGGVFVASLEPGVGFSVSATFPTLRYHNGIHGVNLSS